MTLIFPVQKRDVSTGTRRRWEHAAATMALAAAAFFAAGLPCVAAQWMGMTFSTTPANQGIVQLFQLFDNGTRSLPVGQTNVGNQTVAVDILRCMP